MRGISWNMYWVATAATVGSYYLIIYWLFFRGRKGSRGSKKDITLSGPRTNTRAGVADKAAGSGERSGQSVGPEAVLQTQVHDMVDELGAFLRQAGKEKVEKAGLIAGVQKIAGKYPLIKESAFREGIQNLVAVTMEEHCACRLSAEEVRRIWDGGEA